MPNTGSWKKNVDVKFSESISLETNHYLLSTKALTPEYLGNYTLLMNNEHCQLYQFKE